jgi:hypothetical protein
MSFDISYKPKLVESKIINRYNDKILKKVMIKENNFVNEKIKYLFSLLLTFIKNNYGFFLLFISIFFLLYIRYIEVNKKKEIIKKYINN